MTALTHKENDLHNRLIVAEFNLQQVEAELRRLHEENKALRARLAQPEPEPVAWADKYDIEREGHDFWVSRQQPAKNGVELYTTPPQRPWVGLTDDEVNNFAAGCHLGKSVQGAIYEAAAMLKEKNA